MTKQNTESCLTKPAKPPMRLIYEMPESKLCYTSVREQHAKKSLANALRKQGRIAGVRAPVFMRIG
jgi:hypothetical protein